MLILNGVAKEVPGIVTSNWRDNNAIRLKMGNDGRSRPKPRIRRIIIHSTGGIPGGRDQRPQVILPGFGPPGNAAEDNVGYWTGNAGQAGAHLLVDRDGSVIQTCDLVTEMAYHMPGTSFDSIGIEIVQFSRDASIYQGQLDVTARLVRWLCGQTGVQFQTHWPYRVGRRRLNLDAYQGPVGVFAHYQGDQGRGIGDPGDAMWLALESAGIEKFDFFAHDADVIWKERQRELGVKDDGDPGPTTVAALKAAGYVDGIRAFGFTA